MIITIASRNPVKVEALTEIIADYSHLKDARIISCETDSGVADQPKSLEETVKGAMNRAQSAFENCDYSFGIESGLMTVSGTKSGFMDVCVCAIYDGIDFHLGLSSAWEPPLSVVRSILDDGVDMNEAALRAGFTGNPKVGSAQGLVGIMTNGRLTRKAYTIEAIRTALIHIDVEKEDAIL